MTLEEKIKEFEELSKINFPSDEVIARRDCLVDEIKMELQDQGSGNQTSSIPKDESQDCSSPATQETKKEEPRKKRSLLEIILQRIRNRRKETPEQKIFRLQQKYAITKLEAGIAINKKKKREAKSSVWSGIFGGSNKNNDGKDITQAMGTNSKDYSGLTGRKRKNGEYGL